MLINMEAVKVAPSLVPIFKMQHVVICSDGSLSAVSCCSIKCAARSRRAHGELLSHGGFTRFAAFTAMPADDIVTPCLCHIHTKTTGG